MRGDSGELGKLAADLEQAGSELEEQAKKITEVAMAKIKKGAQTIVRGHSHLPKLARSYTYDVTNVAGTITGEVGAELRRGQGGLDHLIENGTVRNAPIPHWAPEADKEVPIWESMLERAAVEAIERDR